MNRSDHDHNPDPLDEMARRLVDQRPEATGLELDRIKTRAMARAKVSNHGGKAVRSRGIIGLLTVGLMAGGTGGVIGKGGFGGNRGPHPPKGQYRPPSTGGQNCPDGSVLNSNGQCECPPGTTFQRRGNRCVSNTGSGGGGGGGGGSNGGGQGKGHNGHH